MPEGTVGRGSTHHVALAVGSPDELVAWRDYLQGKGVQTTDVFERGGFTSIYLRDPDGHILEIATSLGIRPALGRRSPGEKGAPPAGLKWRQASASTGACGSCAGLVARGLDSAVRSCATAIR